MQLWNIKAVFFSGKASKTRAVKHLKEEHEFVIDYMVTHFLLMQILDTAKQKLFQELLQAPRSPLYYSAPHKLSDHPLHEEVDPLFKPPKSLQMSKQNFCNNQLHHHKFLLLL